MELELSGLQITRHVAYAVRCPDIIIERELVTVGMGDELCAHFDNSIGNDRRAKDIVLFREQYPGKIVEVPAGEIPNRAQLARPVVAREPPALDLEANAVRTNRIDIWMGVSHPHPAERLAEEMLGQVARRIV